MCIVDHIQSSVCRLHMWQDVRYDRTRSGVAPTELSSTDLRQPSTIVTRRMNVVQVSMVGIYHQGIVCIQKYGGEHTLRRSRSMKVKVVQLSDTHVMRVLNFCTPERTSKATPNKMKTRRLK